MHEKLKEYYGKYLKSSKDLQTSACCCDAESIPVEIRNIMSEIDNEILEKFYGCGSPFPPALENCTILDLGCGTGRDVYIASKLVGEKGSAIGIDMTAEQLEVANRHIDPQMKKFGYSKSNVSFKNGYIEDLKELGIKDNSVDVVISNCVINLSPDKRSVFSEILRVLKPGGELYFSDVFSSRRIPKDLMNDPVLHGECLSGAMYIEDFRRLLRELGCMDYRVMTKSKIDINNPEIEKKIGMIDFYSYTIRVFKLEKLEDICEDYGQSAIYKGTISGHPHYFNMDDHHKFITGKPMLVCSNTAAMVQDTRFGSHFNVTGDISVHYGAFDCSSPVPASQEAGCSSGACC